MSDYVKTTDFSVKDGLTTGDPNKVVSGTEHDDEYNNIATAVATKANKKLPATTNNLAALSASGDLVDSGFYLSGTGGEVTSTAAELNILDGVTATAAEINALDGITSTVAELNILDGVTATAAEINLLDGVTATTAEINLLDDPNTASKVCQLDAGAQVPTAQMPDGFTKADNFTGSLGSIGSGTWSGLTSLTLTNVSTVYAVIISYTTTASIDEGCRWMAIDENNYLWTSSHLFGTKPSAASAGQVDFRLYNTSTTSETITYKVTVIGI